MKAIFKINWLGVMAFILMVSVLSGCSKFNDEEEFVVTGDSKFRIVNTVQGSDPQDFLQDGSKIYNGLAYGEVSSLIDVKAGNSNISFSSAVNQKISATLNVAATPNLNYTVFYYSTATGGGLIAGFQDDNGTPPATGKAKIRFINFGAGLSNAVNANSSTGAILTGLTYNGISAYYTVDVNLAINLSVVGSTNNTEIPASTLQSGKTYYIWLDATNSTTVNYHLVQQN